MLGYYLPSGAIAAFGVLLMTWKKMMARMKTRYFIVMATVLSPAFAASDLEIGEAIGGYLGSADLKIRFKKSQCGYAMNVAPPSFEARLKEVMSAIPPNLAAKVGSFIKSGEFNSLSEDNQILIDSELAKYMQGGRDLKTSCGMLLATVALATRQSESAWLKMAAIYKGTGATQSPTHQAWGSEDRAQSSCEQHVRDKQGTSNLRFNGYTIYSYKDKEGGYRVTSNWVKENEPHRTTCYLNKAFVVTHSE